MNIVLIGFMGTGKSTIGQLLAARLSYNFLDTDGLIEERTGLRVADIFARRGEPYFRSLEVDLARELVATDCNVIATGGGFILNPENMKAMQHSGYVIALSAAPHVIWERVKDNGERPLLQTPDPLKRIAGLLEKRAPIYNQANLIVDTSNKTLDEIVAEIYSELIRRGILDGRS